jgi:hypothetical protein
MDFSKLPPEILAKLTPEQMEEMERLGDHQNQLIAKHIDAFGELIEKTISEIGDGHAGPVIAEILAIFTGIIIARAHPAIHPQILLKTISVIVDNMNASRPPDAQIKMATLDPSKTGDAQIVGTALDFGKKPDEDDDIRVRLH